MSENANLTYNDFSAGYTAGDGMTIIDKQTTLEDIMNWVFSGKSLWFYDGQKYMMAKSIGLLSISKILKMVQ